MKRPLLHSSKMYLTVSIVAAALAAVTLFAYLQSIRSRIAQCGRLVPLVVAARDLEAGEVLDPSSLAVIDFPDRYLLPGTFSDPLALAGNTLGHNLEEGEPLLQSSLLPPGGGGLAQNSLDQGFRAYPLPVTSVSFPSGELADGGRVDVLAISKEGAYLLLENVEVIGVYGAYLLRGSGGEAAAAGADTASACILLQITGEEACRLAAAQEAGRVEVMLRPGLNP